MRTKYELGLPLIETAATANMPPQQRAELDKAFVEAAREAGNLFLANGDIPLPGHSFEQSAAAFPLRAP